jgi:hypothetical protein
MPGDRGPIRGRSTTDLLILMIAGTICFAVLAAGATVGVIQIKNPGANTSTAYKSIQDVINTLIGLLAGFLAGRTETTRESRQEYRQTTRRLERGDDETEEIEPVEEEPE